RRTLEAGPPGVGPVNADAQARHQAAGHQIARLVGEGVEDHEGAPDEGEDHPAAAAPLLPDEKVQDDAHDDQHQALAQPLHAVIPSLVRSHRLPRPPSAGPWRVEASSVIPYRPPSPRLEPRRPDPAQTLLEPAQGCAILNLGPPGTVRASGPKGVGWRAGVAQW